MLVTNRGKKNILAFLRSTTPANFYVALCTSATAPTVDINTLSELTEVTAGNGYTAGGVSISLNSTDFDTLSEDDTNDRALIQLKDVSWTASGGNLPSTAARYAVLLGPHATPGSREVWVAWDLASDRQVSDGQALTLQDLEVRAA